MATKLTEKALALSKKSIIKQQLVVEIEGIDTIYGAVHVTKRFEYGDAVAYGDVGLVYGGTVRNPNSRDYISINGSSSSITQQLLQDKGGSGSVSGMTVNLVDKNNYVSNEFRELEMLSRKATIFLAFQEGEHPRDSIEIFNGNISGIKYGAGHVKLSIDHPEQLKRVSIFPNVTSSLLNPIDNSQTSIELLDTNGLVLPSGNTRSFIRVEDELIEFTGITDNVITGCTRGAELTVATAHDEDTDTASFYRLDDNPIDLALKLMLSGRGYDGEAKILAFNVLSATTYIESSIFFGQNEFESFSGLIIGDFIQVKDSLGNQNDLIDAKVTGFGESAEGYYITIDQSLIDEIVTDQYEPTISWKSQYDLMPQGASLSPREVDSKRHLEFKTLIGTSLPDYKLYLKDTVELKEFIEKEIYFPVGLYQVPRQGKSSVGATLPPISTSKTLQVNSSNVINPNTIDVNRSTSKSFYNSIIYKFNESQLDDKFLGGVIHVSEDSNNQIKVGTKALTIESKGIRDTESNRNYLSAQSRRFLDRYQFSARRIKAKVAYSDAFNVDIGDTVIFGDKELQMVDNESSGSIREFNPTLMEVTNKRLSLTSANVELELTDTAYNLDGRYVTFAPSSYVDVNSSLTEIRLKQSFGWNELEGNKWEDYIGQEITIHNDDWSVVETVNFIKIKDGNPNILLVDGLTQTPQENWIVDAPTYNDDDEKNRIWKVLHGSFSPQVNVVNGVSELQIEVSPADIDKFNIGAVIEVHREDYSIRTEEVKISEINGNILTVSKELGIIVDNTYLISLIGFRDNGTPYRYL